MTTITIGEQQPDTVLVRRFKYRPNWLKSPYTE
jgi:hypothetical protein